MNYIDTYPYTEIHAIELEIPKCCIRFLFIHLIVRKIGISCEVIVRSFLSFCYPVYAHSTYFLILSVSIHSSSNCINAMHINNSYISTYRMPVV